MTDLVGFLIRSAPWLATLTIGGLAYLNKH
jgi:hypothetical protein